MLYNATNIKTIFDKKKTLEGLLIKKSKIIVSNYRIEDRIGYDDASGMTSVYDAGAPTATAMKTYNLDDLYTWSPVIGCATAMSVRCVKK